jgi:hypothetical protein
MQKAPCGICRNDQAEYETTEKLVNWQCPRCGQFCYDKADGPPMLGSTDDMVRLSGWVREQNDAGIVPVRLSTAITTRVMSMKLPRLPERAMRLLVALAHYFPTGNNFLTLMPTNPELEGVSYSRDGQELLLLLNILEDSGLVQSDHGAFSISARGLMRAEELGTSGSGSQGFVAMWFDDSMNDAWLNGFEPAIREARYFPRRIDSKDYVGGVSDEIMAEIRRSRFVVVDYTGQRNGVYFEAGFAAGLGLTIIPTCRSDHIGNLHFDIRHLNTLSWNTPRRLADKLSQRIKAVIGAGPNATDQPRTPTTARR